MELSLRAYSRHRGCTLRAVQKAIESGRIKKTASGKIDRDVADLQWGEGTRPSAPQAGLDLSPAAPDEIPGDVFNALVAGGQDNGPSYHAARARREEADANLAELKYERERRNLVSSEEVSRTLARIGRIHASSRESIPSQLAPKLVGKTDLDEIEAIIRKELTDADTRTCHEIGKRFPEIDASADGIDADIVGAGEELHS